MNPSVLCLFVLIIPVGCAATYKLMIWAIHEYERLRW